MTREARLRRTHYSYGALAAFGLSCMLGVVSLTSACSNDEAFLTGDAPAIDAGTRDSGNLSGDSGAHGLDASGEAGDASADATMMTMTLTPAAVIDKIASTAAGSTCAKYTWKNRGKMPVGYVKGVALSFARSVCRKDSADVIIVSKAKTTDTADDALAWFAKQFEALKMDNSVSGLETFRHVYTLLMGLGMRESTGRHCVGRDATANNIASTTAEAGAWQTSLDSQASNAELPKMFARTKIGDAGCFLDVYAEGVTCDADDWKNWGTGADGLRFQELEKKCPGFAAEYAAVMLRANGGSSGHYGPLRRREAEIRPECDAMLEQVQTLVTDNPQVCSDF
jgi:hypothetical protein